MIKAKIKLHKPPHLDDGVKVYFTDTMPPFRHKVCEQLRKTQLLNKLIIPLEQALYYKACREAEELQCHQDFTLFSRHYLAICRHLLANLTSGNTINNTQFIDLVNQGKLEITTAINLNPPEMHETRWKTEIDKTNYRINESLKPPTATSNLFTCGKCRQNETTYYYRQDRSSDEGFTTHITCVRCGHKWRQ